MAGSSCCSGRSLVAVSGAPAAVQGFSSRGASHCRARAGGARFQELRLAGSGAQTQELRCRGLAPPRHVGSSWLGIEPVPPALTGGFFTTEPPAKPTKELSETGRALSVTWMLVSPQPHGWKAFPVLSMG